MLARTGSLDSAAVFAVRHAPPPDEGDPSVRALLLLLRSGGATSALASVHSPSTPPMLLDYDGLEAGDVESLLLSLDREVTFDRRRRGDRMTIRVPLTDGIRLEAHSFPLHRDTVVLLASNAPPMHEQTLAWVDAYLELWWRLRRDRQWNDGLRGAIDLLDLGVVMLDAEANIGFANRVAERLLNVGDGIRRLGASLSATSFEDAVRLQMAIGLASQPLRGRSPMPRLTLRRAKGRPIVAAVAVASKPPRHSCDPAAIVYLLDPDIDVGRLLGPVCDDYGLTVSEAQLARSVVAGATLAEAAASQRIRLDTARSYLKQVFAKTRTHRQAELVRVMLAGVLRAGPGAVPPA